MSSNTFDLGDVAALAVAIRDSTGTLANAGAVTCSITLPDGTSTSPSVTNTSTGNYAVAYVPIQTGRHVIRWVATGANASAIVDVFDVIGADPRFIISLSDAKESLNIDATNTSHDEELRQFIAAATDVIESIAGPILARTVIETYDGGNASVILRNAPVASVTSVTESGNVLAATDYALDINAGTLTRTFGVEPWQWRYGFGNVAVTYRVGAPAVPGYVVLAARELVRHWYQRGQQSPRPSFGGTSSDDGSQYVSGYAIPNYVVGMLAPSGGIPGIA